MGRLFNKDEKFFISPNLPNDGGKLHFTETGTSTLLATFSDKGLSAANVNPIILNSDGKLPVDVFLDPSLYRMRVTDSADIQISLTENVSAIISAGDTQQDLRTTGTVVMSGSDPITIGGSGTNTLNSAWIANGSFTLSNGETTFNSASNLATFTIKNTVGAFNKSLITGDATRASSALYDFLRFRSDADGSPVEAFRVRGDGSLTMVGVLSVDDTTESTSTTTGSIHTDGGLGVAKNVFLGGTLDVANGITLTDGQLLLTNTTASQEAFTLTHSDASNPFGATFDFSGGSTDDNSHWFLRCQDSTTVRCFIWSDGDLANHDGTYGTISARELKDNIEDVRSYWDDFKTLKYHSYFMKDDLRAYGSEADRRLGLINDEVALTFPKLAVGEGSKGWVKSSIIDGVINSIVLQEAMKRIEELEAKVTALGG